MICFSRRSWIFVIASVAACRTTTTTTTTIEPTPVPVRAIVIGPVKHADWTKNIDLYEINVRQGTPEGTLNAFAKHLPDIAKMGIDAVWIMPVQPIGKVNRKGSLGSYYSIANYTQVNPELGTLADFHAFVDEAHRDGLRVLLDWVPNHTSFDNPWITEHPDWYTHRKDGSISNPLDEQGHETDWTDVAELNYDNPAMRRAMMDAMEFWLDSMHVDGFREDVAWGVPMDFWIAARRELQAKRPDIFMLAEAEGNKYYTAFDATYGWEFHHMLNMIAQGKTPTDSIDAYLARGEKSYPASAYRMYFTSNHDENSWAGTEFERMGANHIPAYVLASTIEQAMPLLYTGQEASFNRRLRFFDKDTVDWSGPSLVGFYSTMYDLRHRNQALWNGDFGGPQVKLATDGGPRTYAFTRTKGANTVLVAVNFGDAPAHVNYRGFTVPGDYTDWFTKAPASLAATGTLDVPAHGYRILVK